MMQIILEQLYHGYTYQFYNDNDGKVNPVPTELSMQALVPVRLETIQVKGSLTAEQLKRCYFHYYDAAILELWRESKHQCPLKGTIFYSANDFPAVKKEPNRSNADS